MNTIRSGLRRWLRDMRIRMSTAVPFAMDCSCGHVLQGHRKATAQVLPCPRCKAPVFVLGISPLPPVPGASPKDVPQSSRMIAPPTRSAWKKWALPVGVSAFAFVAMISLVFILVNEFMKREPDPTPQERVAEHQDLGEKAWKEKKYALAASELKAARKMREQFDLPQPLPESRRLRQMERQADLAAQSLGQPLHQLLDEWKDLRSEDLQQLFSSRQGKTVVFDILIQREPSGRYQYQTNLGFPLPHLELSNQTILQSLPLREKQRLLFGVKLASIERDRKIPDADPRRQWIIGFVPDSTVLITDRQILTVFDIPYDEETGKHLKTQMDWVLERQ